MHYLGIDIGKNNHMAGLIGEDGKPICEGGCQPAGLSAQTVAPVFGQIHCGRNVTVVELVAVMREVKRRACGENEPVNGRYRNSVCVDFGVGRLVIKNAECKVQCVRLRFRRVLQGEKHTRIAEKRRRCTVVNHCFAEQADDPIAVCGTGNVVAVVQAGVFRLGSGNVDHKIPVAAAKVRQGVIEVIMYVVGIVISEVGGVYLKTLLQFANVLINKNHRQSRWF